MSTENNETTKNVKKVNREKVSNDKIKKSSTGEIKKKTTKVKSDAPKHVKETETVNEQPKKEKKWA